MIRGLFFSPRFLVPVVFTMLTTLILGTFLLVTSTTTYAQPVHQNVSKNAPMTQAAQGACTGRTCTFQLGVNPALLKGPFACPAIQHAQASITILNRFAINAQNDVMTLTAKGLPANTGFDMFLVENSPLDSGKFAGFGFGWYQSDLQSNAAGVTSVRVQGIFDKETFIENPADPFKAIHTFNVGFWFNSPTDEQKVCGNQTAPAATPFNGEQNAGLLAMITQGEPLQFVQ